MCLRRLGFAAERGRVLVMYMIEFQAMSQPKDVMRKWKVGTSLRCKDAGWCLCVCLSVADEVER